MDSPMTITIYGIKNCDTMKKARAWLDRPRRGLCVSTTTRPPASTASGWSAGAKKVGWETLLNRAGTTFRKLPDADKEGLDAAKAMALMLAQPSMIKRPVLDLGGGKLLVGFKPESYGALVTSRMPHAHSGYRSTLPISFLRLTARRGGCAHPIGKRPSCASVFAELLCSLIRLLKPVRHPNKLVLTNALAYAN